MECNDKNGVMKGLMRAVKTISERAAGSVGMEEFEELSCAMMELVCIALFGMWKNREFTGEMTFSDLLNLFNDQVISLAESEKKAIRALREQISEELKATGP
ncbi:MAG: hypothetical protein JXQ30_15600 [Spirochaetes bacterium]|nr:hypothetical protein [Spirochaetota bacterium]